MVKERGRSRTDEVHRALAHADRRHLLNELEDREEPLDMTDPTIENVDDSLQVRVKFRHLHLPLLDGYDFIEWDRQAAEVSCGKRFGEVRPWLDEDQRATASVEP